MKNREDWYGYIYPKNFIVLSKPKLVIPDISDKMRVAIDISGDIIFSGGGAGGNGIIVDDERDSFFLMGLLNSKLVEVYVRQNGTQFRGGYLNCEVRFLKDIPIHLPQNKNQNTLAQKIIKRSQNICQLKGKANTKSLSDRERESINRQIESYENQINQLVYELYGLTDEEIAIVEEAQNSQNMHL